MELEAQRQIHAPRRRGMKRTRSKPATSKPAPERAMEDDELQAWLLARRPLRPLAHSVSMLDGVVTAVVAGPISMHPHTWICPLLAIGPEAFDNGGTPEYAAIAAVTARHNAISERLVDGSRWQPLLRRMHGDIDPSDWCNGFMKAVMLNEPRWKDVLNPHAEHYGLMMPILLYSKDALGRPYLTLGRKGAETEAFIKQAHNDIPMVVNGMRELFQEVRFGTPHYNVGPRPTR